MMFDSILFFIIITGFYIIHISQIARLGTDFHWGEENVEISTPGSLAHLYEKWVNNWIKGLLIDGCEKRFQIDLYDEKYYDPILGSYSYVVMYPFRLLDFLVVYILHGELE